MIKDGSATARNVQTVAGIAIDKIMPLGSRPSVIVENRLPAESIRRIAAIAPEIARSLASPSTAPPRR